jgi:hypothetical protein
VAAVRFAFGAKPGIDEHDARELAELMARRRTLAHKRVAAKLRSQADVALDAGEKSEDIVLYRDELDALATTLAEEPWAQQQEWFEKMRYEVMQARAVTPPEG